MAAHLAMRLLQDARVLRAGLGRTARVTGDNLQVIRYAAGVSRFARPYLQAPLDAGLQSLARLGFQVQWQAVRRRLNTAADSVATAALLWAVACSERRPPPFFLWRDSAPLQPSGLEVPPWPSAT
jgi:hypothetical protein